MRRLAVIVSLALASTSGSAAPVAADPLAPRPAPPGVPPPAASASVASAIADWQRLRMGSGSFADYARFFHANPGWPEERRMRAAAEKLLRPGEAAANVLNFFHSDAPQTGAGWARLAESQAAYGRAAEALAAAREAWGSGDLSAADEALIRARFGASFTTADHDRRVDALLFARNASDAYRMLPYASAERRPAFEARLAIQSGQPDSEQRFVRVVDRLPLDAGLLMDRARQLRDRGQESAARQLFAQPHRFVHRPADPARLLEMMVALSSGAVRDRQWALAYAIASQLDDLFAPGADVSLKSYAIRDDYTTLAWTAGITAVQRLRRPDDAVRLFDRYANGGRSLQVASKGYYWAGRAAGLAGRSADATTYFEKAAAYPELFYGQLALERLRRPVPPPAGLPALLPSPAERSAFAGNRLAQAVRLLGQWGRTADQALFVRALADGLASNNERVLAAEFATQVRRPDLAVWIARSARNAGSTFYYQAAFPTHRFAITPPHGWALTHGITRQESSFDTMAVSGAGARGMMQLMTGTAREQAGKMGLGYSLAALTGDPAYNVSLGSAYFQRMLDYWGGSYPLAVASYNAGPGNVRKWINAYGDPRTNAVDMIEWIESIPFSETRGYVQRVLENSVVYDQLNPAGGAGRIRPVHLSVYLGKTGRPG